MPIHESYFLRSEHIERIRGISPDYARKVLSRIRTELGKAEITLLDYARYIGTDPAGLYIYLFQASPPTALAEYWQKCVAEQG